MMQSDPRALFTTLHATLSREADLIRRADFAALTACSVDKEHLMAQLSLAAPANPQHLTALHAHASRNQALMAAALRGVTAARRRFERLRDAQTALHTYDHLGRKNDIAVGDTATRIERRA